jgi:hypothetical protein
MKELENGRGSVRLGIGMSFNELTPEGGHESLP